MTDLLNCACSFHGRLRGVPMPEPMSREQQENIRSRLAADPSEKTKLWGLLLAAYEEDIADLLAEVDRLREENERLKEALRD